MRLLKLSRFVPAGADLADLAEADAPERRIDWMLRGDDGKTYRLRQVGENPTVLNLTTWAWSSGEFTDVDLRFEG